MNLETFMNPEAFALILCKHSLSLFIWREIRSERDAGIDGFSENWNNLCNYQRKDMLSKIRELRRNIFTACRYCHCRPRSLRVGLMVWPWITSISLQLAVFQVQSETSRNFCHLGESWQVYRRLSEGFSFHLSDSNTRRSLKHTNMLISDFDRFASGSIVRLIMERGHATMTWQNCVTAHRFSAINKVSLPVNNLIFSRTITLSMMLSFYLSLGASTFLCPNRQFQSLFHCFAGIFICRVMFIWNVASRC